MNEGGDQKNASNRGYEKEAESALFQQRRQMLRLDFIEKRKTEDFEGYIAEMNTTLKNGKDPST